MAWFLWKSDRYRWLFRTVVNGTVGFLVSSCALFSCGDVGDVEALPPPVEEPVDGESPGVASYCPEYSAPVQVSTLPDVASETSGMAASRTYADTLWLHNDSGDDARLYAVQVSTGALLATITLNGIRARDWEAMGIGACADGTSCIYVGDIGDNLAQYDRVHVIRFAEPDPSLGDQVISDAEVMHATYSDVKAVDAEALFVDGEDVYVLSKAVRTSTLYHARFERSEDTVRFNALQTISLPSAFMTTAADLHPSEPRILVRGYGRLLEFVGEAGDTPAEILARPPVRRATGRELQSEAVTYTESGFLHTAEGKGVPLYQADCLTSLAP